MSERCLTTSIIY